MKAKKVLSSLLKRRLKYNLYKSSASSSAAADDDAELLSSPSDEATLSFIPPSEDSSRLIAGEVVEILDSTPYHVPQETVDEERWEKELECPWITDLLGCGKSPDEKEISSGKTLLEKEITRERKSRFGFWTFQVERADKFVDVCCNKLGAETVIDVFKKLGKGTGVKERNVLMRRCIEGARIAPDEVVARKHLEWAFKIFRSMKEHGFELHMDTYGPILEYFTDMGMTEEFSIFCRVIKEDKPSLPPEFGYHEMMLWIRVNDVKKIQELCKDVESCDGENKSKLQQKYLLALCESDRTEEILQLLESMDITKLSSSPHLVEPDLVARVFKCLGRLLLESFAEKVFLEFKTSDCAAENTSSLIYSYVVGIPNLQVEDVVLKFKNLHTKLEVTPSSASYEKLLMYCCDSLKVHVALEVVDEMFGQGLTFSLGALHSILQASSQSCDFNLVHQIYPVITRANLTPNAETFRGMICLCVKMKDYEGAYSMLSDAQKMNVKHVAPMYNAIMYGYFREKNKPCALRVFKQMKEANVKPDSQTFSFLIINCNSEEDINMYYEEMTQYHIEPTKHVFKALVNAYVACGQFEKAKQVLLDVKIPGKSLNEIKSVLVQALASHGQLSDAFNTYEGIKKAGNSLEPKAVISLIEHLQSDEEALSRILDLLETLDDPHYWLDGCLRTIKYCVRYKHLRPAISLLEQVRDQVYTDELDLEVIFDQVFFFIAESESTSLHFGLDLLHSMKSELGLTPSRKSLDFLLQACVSAKDLQSSLFVWQEYQAAGLPYNTLSFLRMYQALLAAGDQKAAEVLGSKIPKDDPHVRCIIESCNVAYSEKKKKAKKKKKRMK